MIALLIAAVLAAAAPPPAPKCTTSSPHDPTALKYICDSERGWAESVASGDPTTVKRILADDFIGVDPDGKHYRKAEMVADTAKGLQYFASNKINDIIVRFYGNMAIAQGSETGPERTAKRAVGSGLIRGSSGTERGRSSRLKT